jgi:hypothetical protein
MDLVHLQLIQGERCSNNNKRILIRHLFLFLNFIKLCFFKIISYTIQGVLKVPPFLKGTSFRDVEECWKNIKKNPDPPFRKYV